MTETPRPTAESPATEAGKDLVSQMLSPKMIGRHEFTRLILAIEAEAVTPTPTQSPEDWSVDEAYNRGFADGRGYIDDEASLRAVTPSDSALREALAALRDVVRSFHKEHEWDADGNCNWGSCQRARALLASQPKGTNDE